MNDQALKSAITKYATGFVISLLLTLASFWLVFQYANSDHKMTVGAITGMILVFAVVQLIVQLTFFLHLGEENKPRWNIVTFLFMIIVLVILVFGSLWIMDNLNYNMMEPEQTKEYLRDHPGSF